MCNFQQELTQYWIGTGQDLAMPDQWMFTIVKGICVTVGDVLLLLLLLLLLCSDIRYPTNRYMQL